MPIPRPACFAAPTVAAVRAAEAKARASGRAITGGDLAEAIAEVGGAAYFGLMKVSARRLMRGGGVECVRTRSGEMAMRC